uniref:glutathione S-transferase omega-1-like n=1 Tax=Pristiophorus japonicus TaxID=55135 RepID=UPI00398F8D85
MVAAKAATGEATSGEINSWSLHRTSVETTAGAEAAAAASVTRGNQAQDGGEPRGNGALQTKASRTPKMAAPCGKPQDGSSAPGSVPEGTIHLYSMKYCPFTCRTRVILEAKEIKYETVNINLLNKPNWFFEKNPLGLVPVLENCQSQLIDESPITCEFLDKSYPARRFLPTDPYQKAKQKMLLELFNKIPWGVSAFIRLCVAVHSAMDFEGKDKLEEEFQAQLNNFEQELAGPKTRFFGGDSVTMIDYMLWPWFTLLEPFSLSKFLELTPGLRSWMQAMQQDPAVKATATDSKAYLGFFQLYTQGNLEACDYSL